MTLFIPHREPKCKNDGVRIDIIEENTKTNFVTFAYFMFFGLFVSSPLSPPF
jgi:hypothetical protein